MTWDAWTCLVLAVALLSMLRPVWATIALRRLASDHWRKQSLRRAGGGAAMLTMAAYLVIEARSVIGRGFWDMVVVSVHSPFMRLLPSVWVPALCWLLMVVLGFWFLYRGAKRSRGPRNSLLALWALNEVAVGGALLWWAAYVPDSLTQATWINFALTGLYLGFIAGGLTRFMLVMWGPDITDLEERGLPAKARHWLGRIRRY